MLPNPSALKDTKKGSVIKPSTVVVGVSAATMFYELVGTSTHYEVRARGESLGIPLGTFSARDVTLRPFGRRRAAARTNQNNQINLKQ